MVSLSNVHRAVGLMPIVLLLLAIGTGCSPRIFYVSDYFLRWDTLDPQPRLDGIDRLRARAKRDLVLLVAARSVHTPRDVRQWILAWRQDVDKRDLVVDRVLILHEYGLPHSPDKRWSVSLYYHHPQENDDWYLDDVSSIERQFDGIAFYDQRPSTERIAADLRWKIPSDFRIVAGAVREKTWRAVLDDEPIEVD